MTTKTPLDLYNALKDVKVGGTTCKFTMEKCEEIAPVINEINRLKKEKNALILAHSYVSPEIIHGVADVVGDSYELSKRAKETNADTIIFAAVRFMAETAKLLNPTKQVIIPSHNNGCTLADSITGDDVKALRAAHPDYTFVCYINTVAEVKAHCDVCVTSSNVYKIITEIPNDKIYFLPDKLMGENIQHYLTENNINKTLKYTDGTCYVHEAYDPEMIDFLKLEYPGVKVLAHPECKPEVLSNSDYVGSTSQMVNYVKENNADHFFLLTECGLTSRLQLESPQKSFIGSCTLCKYMHSNTLDQILQSLKNPDKDLIVSIPEDTQEKALACINAMFDYA